MLGALLIIGGGVLLGLLIGRWWALVVPLVLAAILYRPEEAPGDDLAGFELVWAALAFLGAVIGVLLRKGVASAPDDTAPRS